MQIKNAGVAGYVEAFSSVRSDSQTSERYSYFDNDVLVSERDGRNYVETGKKIKSERLFECRS